MRMFNLIIILAIVYSCGSKEKNVSNHDFIIQYIEDFERQEIFSDSPLIVIDGVPLSLDDYYDNNRPLIKSEIKTIDYIEKENQSSIYVYGDRAKGGVILVISKGLNYRYKTIKTKNEILILYDHKTISIEEFQKLNPDDIEEFEVIEDKDEIKKLYDTDYIKIIKIISKNYKIE
jgi:hypothetical protein